MSTPRPSRLRNNRQSCLCIDIPEHQPFLTNVPYSIYLSNLEVPNVVFVATLDDYVHATLLVQQMNKQEKIAQAQAHSYKSK